MVRKITPQVKSDLRGKFAIVTGGRIKIGLRIALRLLRDGCFVIVTTRLGFLFLRLTNNCKIIFTTEVEFVNAVTAGGRVKFLPAV